MYDFQSAMADGKARAHRERNRGCSSSVRIVSTEELYMGMTEEDWQSWQDELADAVDAASAGEGMDETEEETSIPPAIPTLSGKMTAKQYVKTLKRIGLTPHSAPQALGISASMSFRYAAGTHPIPITVAKLLRALAELGRAEI